VSFSDLLSDRHAMHITSMYVQEYTSAAVVSIDHLAAWVLSNELFSFAQASKSSMLAFPLVEPARSRTVQ